VNYKFPPAVPEIPVSDIARAMAYYKDHLDSASTGSAGRSPESPEDRAGCSWRHRFSRFSGAGHEADASTPLVCFLGEERRSISWELTEDNYLSLEEQPQHGEELEAARY